MPRGTFAPSLRHILDEVRDRLAVLVCRSKIPAFCITFTLFGHKAFREEDVAAQRLKHMLPRANGTGAANFYRNTFRERTDHVGDEPVGRPVAATNDVPRPGTGDKTRPRACIGWGKK